MEDHKKTDLCSEEERLRAANSRELNWQRWGTYLPERQWGTVREDYSADGDCWSYFPYEMAQFRAYRWGEDGLLGWTDRECRLCFSTSLWNGKDSMLKERLFGLTNPEGNHGEDVKELYYYLDGTPTHSYAKGLYKYPQRAFPYEQLRNQGRTRGLNELEHELLDTGIFDEDRYFDLTVEYAKADVEDMLIRLSITNCGPEAADITVLPTLTFRNDWSWNDQTASGYRKPLLTGGPDGRVHAEHSTLGNFVLLPVDDPGSPTAVATLFTENDTNYKRIDPNFFRDSAGFWKDAFDRYVVHSDTSAINPAKEGTKAALVYSLNLQPGERAVIALRLVRVHGPEAAPPNAVNVDAVFAQRIEEANVFYARRMPAQAGEEEKNISRQAYAGLLWSKQYYYYVAEEWSQGDDLQPAPPRQRKRNYNWRHLYCRDILSVPDKWEYPWFAAWDLAFHMIPMATLDPAFAKSQLLLLLREWYMHPNGQMPAYEFNFGDVNPPVHAWAVWHVYRAGQNAVGTRDLDFLERAFQKLMLNFTWWVNRNDAKGRNLFGGGFLGLDNIGVFDRSQLPEGIALDQADATAWMGLYCSSMLQMAIELAQSRPAYEDIANKFFEHYISVINAMNTLDGTGLWDEEDGFYFDRMTRDAGSAEILKIRSIVGLVPLFGICIMRRQLLENLHELKKRSQWFRDHKPQLATLVSEASTDQPGFEDAIFMGLVPKERLIRILRTVLDETEFLSPFGVRSVSKFHKEHPFEIDVNGSSYRVEYAHAEGTSGMFGGNSNWRGPVWFPINALVCLALDQYHLVYGNGLKVECPTGSGCMMTLQEVSGELNRRLTTLFLPDAAGHRPCHGGEQRYAAGGRWSDLLLFHEYFSGDSGRGVGASHQTGWTALIASAILWRYSSSEERLRIL